MRAALAAAVLLCATATASRGAAGDDALAAIDACVPRLDVALDVGYEKVAARCPRLAAALERSGWEQWLPSGWKEASNDLSAGSLVELRELVVREQAQPRADGPRPRVERLAEVLATLGTAEEKRGGLWARFKEWLRSIVERSAQEPRSSWLDGLIQRNGPSQTLIDVLTWAALTAIVALAGLIIFNELRAAGLIRSRVRVAAGAVAAQPRQARRLGWRDVEGAATVDKPRVLLELIILKLNALKRLPPAGALTARELAQTVALDDATDRARLRALALAAERARYSAAALTPETVGEVVERGRKLLENLGGPA